jgi:hypothetical protein
MVDTLLLYISAAPDLEAERDILGRAVTEIPVTLAWRIVQSPLRGEPPDLQAVAQADLHLLLLGGDIRAPIGLEWQVARRAGRNPALFLKQDAPRTPAAHAFVRYLGDQATWQAYKDSADLRLKTLKLLANHIQERLVYYALSPDELDRLRRWQDELESGKAANVDESPGGAGESSVIFSRERYIPSQGVLIQPREEEPDASQDR